VSWGETVSENPTPAQALALEPNLNPKLKAAVRIPDGTMDAMRMPLRFFATAVSSSRFDSFKASLVMFLPKSELRFNILPSA